ncbi:MAG: epoxide hydrolase [Microbacterium sp.]|uniref:epoxide hydrolase family protein n=1 Tax=Microbacterium sp. TaxID=51671 RepID=UPI001AC1F610|nr:epoxide hydrolase family protein [Microbacterium sp.]MBN9152410.1 epoxide hydrolase [Microbacterium sp.]MBN9175284.1 epoxide hydrolase [Microbacterium sp.]
MSDTIDRVTIAVPQEQLDDLRTRLARVRWPAGRTVSDASQGPTLEKIAALVDYWRDAYDWRKAEAELNAWGMYRTTIDGLDIDFLHVRSAEPNATPLIMTHGWPGSVLEFRKVIAPLTDPAAHGLDPEQAFHLVIPVLPGFGFSRKPSETGWTPPRIAKAWVTLMDRLGYERWGAQGGDLGCAVSDEIGRLRPPGLIGTHLNFAMFPPTPDEVRDATAEEEAALADAKYFWENLSGYAKEQSTRPQTIGYSLADSPVGQAAWIYAMFQDTCGTPGDAEASFTLDEILDDVMMYWLPNSGASAARMYWEMEQSGWSSPATVEDPITVPVGFTMPPKEHVRKSRRQLDRRYANVVYFNEPSAGGHFFALEQPDTLVADIRATFRLLG